MKHREGKGILVGVGSLSLMEGGDVTFRQYYLWQLSASSLHPISQVVLDGH